MSESKFYDLHVTGLGYLNRVRMVKPNKGETFLACSISALRGEWNKDGSIKPESTKFDVRVYGQDAIKAIEVLKPHGDEKRKVMIQFKLGDIYPEVFVYEKDVGTRKKGDTGVMIKGRLLKITNAWVDGKPPRWCRNRNWRPNWDSNPCKYPVIRHWPGRTWCRFSPSRKSRKWRRLPGR